MLSATIARDVRPLDPPIDYYRDKGIRYPPPTILEGTEKIEEINRRDAALFMTLYATGARISEALGITVDDVAISPQALTFYIRTKKNPKHPVREIMVIKKVEPWAYDLLLDYIESLRGDVLFPGMHPDKPMTSRNAEKITKRYWRGIVSEEIYKIIRPHLFRHTRLTHLVKFYGFREYELMIYAGWSSPIPARYYVHLYGHDLYEKMLTGRMRIDLERLVLEKMLKEQDGEHVSDEHGW